MPQLERIRLAINITNNSELNFWVFIAFSLIYTIVDVRASQIKLYRQKHRYCGLKVLQTPWAKETVKRVESWKEYFGSALYSLLYLLLSTIRPYFNKHNRKINEDWLLVAPTGFL